MICFDSTAGVYEVYSDTEATEWLGAYYTYDEARDCLERFKAAQAA